jgi:hypothetical protein
VLGSDRDEHNCGVGQHAGPVAGDDDAHRDRDKQHRPQPQHAAGRPPAERRGHSERPETDHDRDHQLQEHVALLLSDNRGQVASGEVRELSPGTVRDQVRPVDDQIQRRGAEEDNGGGPPCAHPHGQQQHDRRSEQYCLLVEQAEDADDSRPYQPVALQE